ncbi:hypothetical protein, partial [Pantoea ananatis]|uniref:hypothetical protein n=1 Tax=Pantoea ananas TaxID=553 RepID=UPI0030C820BD
TDDLFVGKSLLHGDVLMWLMKTLLTSRCVNQRGADHTIKNSIEKTVLPVANSSQKVPDIKTKKPAITRA